MIALVDPGMGNLRSVAKALEAVGADVVLAERPEQLAGAERIVLPGQGAFADYRSYLDEHGFLAALETEVRGKGKPFLGICLGMELLADESLENGTHRGLGWIPGRVVRLPEGESDPRVPHMGWDDVSPARAHSAHPLFTDLGTAPSFYFAHSYHLVPATGSEAVAAICDYGVPLAAAVISGNLFGVQFHPEKSQEMGLRLLRNFLHWDV